MENLPIFDGPFTNFAKVIIDPENDPLTRFFAQSMPKGEKSKKHIEMLQRMQADKERLAENNTTNWSRIKEVILSRFKQKDIVAKTVAKLEYNELKALKYSNAPGFIAHKSKIKKLIELT